LAGYPYNLKFLFNTSSELNGAERNEKY